jgi:hypothetical protein
MEKHQTGNPKEKTPPFCAPGTELRVKVKMLTAVVMEDLGAHALRRKAEHSFLNFPYVCPEPVLVNVRDLV